MDITQLNTLEYLEQINQEPESHTKWELERCGKFTSSKVGDLMTRGRAKGKVWGDTAMKYIYEKVAELATGVPQYSPESRAIEWGNDNEPLAIDRYNKYAQNQIEHMGKTFIPFNDMCGGSPDGYIKSNWIVEVKCPYNSANHIRFLLDRKIDKNYYYQCQANMLFTARDYCMFISYDPRMKSEALELVCIPVKRDEEVCDAILERIKEATEKLLAIQEQTGLKLGIDEQVIKSFD